VTVLGGTRRNGRSRRACWTSSRSIRSRCCSVAAAGCSTCWRRGRAGDRSGDRHAAGHAPSLPRPSLSRARGLSWRQSHGDTTASHSSGCST
jgi:hypothetical protein